jgi:general secretion pathway protein B
MSYILDALKKSEQARKQGEVPDLNSFPDQPRPSRATSTILLYLLSGFLLCTTLAVGLWAVFSRPVVPAPLATAETVIAAPAGITPPPPVAAEATPAATAGPGPTSIQALSPPPEPGPAEDPIPAPATSPAEVAPRPETTADYPADAEPQPTADPARLTNFADLPTAVRDALPELTIGAHYYAKNPSTRMVSINGRIVRQGQRLEGGLILEEITREGVIFSFEGRRFILEVFAR